MTILGRHLIDMHLMHNPSNAADVTCQKQGDDYIEKVRSDPKTKRVFTHADNDVKGFAPEMREHWIDASLAPEKILNGRKGR